MNDDLYKITCNIQAKIAEKQEEVIMQTIQEIGGDKFCEITFDRNKVIEALTMYKNKDKYAEVKHASWKWGKGLGGQYGIWCTNCGAGWTDSPNAEWIALEHDYCGKCGAKMDAK